MLKWNSALVALALLAAAPSQAYDPETYLQANLQAFETELELSPEQMAEVTPILEASAARNREILDSYGIYRSGKFSPDARLDMHQSRKLRRELQAEQNQTRDQLADHLDDDQLLAFRKMRDERQEVINERVKSHR